jgi:hypothetical protein
MHRLFITPALALVFALAPALTVAARQRGPVAGQSDWSAVQALAPGEKLIVRTRDGDRIAGRFVSATDILLVIKHDETDMSFARDNVRLVQLNRGKSRLKGTLWGTAIGAGVGFAVSGALYFPHRGEIIGAIVPASTALGAGIGAGIGAAFAKGNKNVTVYEAP